VTLDEMRAIVGRAISLAYRDQEGGCRWGSNPMRPGGIRAPIST
jgi:hypothetical protein